MTIGIFFGGSHVYLLESFVEQVNPFIIAFGALPGYFFFSAYILLVLFWYVKLKSQIFIQYHGASWYRCISLLDIYERQV